ncbi:MAG: relaxase/mobilization nuclease domain-containing protein, partial [Alphaproteobacteria bacterium]|nr:relaxase/mobilization nuclease domain-containing protein [Alphaproteobacteria bacterium]
MILKGSQRGGATQLAAHLLKTEENEHVEIHEISGFIVDDLHGALKEIHAMSRGTKCKQFMFSVSLNPPQRENTPVEYFEKALTAIEEKTGLTGQPRVIVFHEKEGRRHCHAVWSRINAEELKAINLPYYKMKLRDVSKQLYFDYGWKMPDGLRDARERDPTNYSLAEWQQAKRIGENPKLTKAAFQECWAVSDSRNAFTQALKENGYILARGNRRGYVAVDYYGEVYSLSRWTGLKTKQ